VSESNFTRDLEIPGIGVYIHIPFCKSKCIYCDFVSYTENDFDQYTNYLLEEIQMYDKWLSQGISTLYIGGGTPSIFPKEKLASIVEGVLKHANNLQEFTIEVNPDSFNVELAEFYKSLGVNRLSMGLQGADDDVLKKSGRLYDYETFIRKYDMARRYFDIVNVDFIVGLPGESWKTIQKDVEFVSHFMPEHVSIYMIEVHDESEAKDFLKKPDEQTFLRYDEFLKSMRGLGYERYEISNFSLNSKYCKHNLKYWFNDDYIGLGASAGGHIGHLRYNNYGELYDYYLAISEGKFPRLYEATNSAEREALETLFMGLRTKWGVDVEDIKRKTGIDVSDVIDILKSRFNFFDGRKLNEEGMDFSNLFFVTLLSVWEEYFDEE